MNYFAHALTHLDRPYYAVGTAVPDWLSVVDRKIRFRPQHLEPWAQASEAVQAEVAAGTLRHLHDDGWFHATRGFVEVTNEMTRLFRERLGADDIYHCGFLGHVGMELLLDAILMERFPEEFEEYWRVLKSVDPLVIQSCINAMAKQSTDRLALFIDHFRREQVLRCYSDDNRLLNRLNQVLVRVKLSPLPHDAAFVLAESRNLVRARVSDLLPQEHFEIDVSSAGSNP